jgi:hypothetical protein
MRSAARFCANSSAKPRRPQFWLNQGTYDLRAAAREHQAQIERD